MTNDDKDQRIRQLDDKNQQHLISLARNVARVAGGGSAAAKAMELYDKLVMDGKSPAIAKIGNEWRVYHG